MTSYMNSRVGDHGQQHMKLLEDEGWSRWSWVLPKVSPSGLNWLPRAAAASATNSMAQNHSNTLSLSHTSGGWTSKAKLQQGLPASDFWGVGISACFLQPLVFHQKPLDPLACGHSPSIRPPSHMAFSHVTLSLSLLVRAPGLLY